MSIAADEYTAPPVPLNNRGRTGCLGRLVQVALFFAVISIAFAGQLWAWAGAVLGGEVDAATVTAMQAAVTLLLLLPFAWAWRGVRERAIYRTWFAAALYPLLLAASRTLPPTQSQLVYLLQLLLTLLYLLVLLWSLRRLQQRQVRRQERLALGAGGLAAAAAALFAVPWLLRGALGSPLDVLLALLLGLSFGASAALLLRRLWLLSLSVDSRGRRSDLFTGGLTAGAALVIMASGLSLNGLQLVLMVALPTLGFAAVALSRSTQFSATSADVYDWRPPSLLLGLAVAAILLFMDVSPLALEAGDPALGWAWQAAGLSVFLGGLLAVVVLLRRGDWGAGSTPRIAWAGAAALWAMAAVLYFVGGRPGFYGDRLFVILNREADVSAASAMEDYDARRSFVYDTLVAHADESQADLRATLDELRLGYTPYYLVNAVEVDGGLLAQLLLANRADVSRILPSPRLRPLPEPFDAGLAEISLPDDHAWNLSLLRADQVWEEFGARGQGIVIGQSDSGVDAKHPELADSYRGHDRSSDYAWFDPWSYTPAPVDLGGHGTHTLASVLGSTTGVAPDATWIGCANLQRNLGNPALYLDCMQFMLAPFPLRGDPLRDGDPLRSAHVLNNSWGCPEEHEGCDPLSLQAAVDALRAAGIFVVASAGNEGPRCSTVDDPIAIYDGAFSVGAVDEQRNLAPFSSTGPVTADGSGRLKPDIAAPGVDVWSAYPGGQYAMFSGTSMAGPHVAGVVALLWSANPDLIGDIERTEEILRETAGVFSGRMGDLLGGGATADNPQDPAAPEATPDPGTALIEQAMGAGDACIFGPGAEETPNNLVGYGIVDAYAAVQRALASVE